MSYHSVEEGFVLSKKEPEVAYGELKLVNFQDGVDGKSEKKMVF